MRAAWVRGMNASGGVHSPGAVRKRPGRGAELIATVAQCGSAGAAACTEAPP